MFQRKIPYREGLELGISGTDAPFVLVVQLRQAGSHLTATRSWGSHDNQLTGGFHIIVLTKAIVAGNQFHIMRIAVDGVMDIGFDTHTFQTVAELIGGMLTVVVGDDHRAHHEVALHELLPQSQHILIVGDAKIGTNLILLDVFRTDNDQDLDTVAQLSQHAQLTVGLEPWQDA